MGFIWFSWIQQDSCQENQEQYEVIQAEGEKKKKKCHLAKCFIASTLWSGNQPSLQSLYFQLLFNPCLTRFEMMDDFIISRVDNLEEKAL